MLAPSLSYRWHSGEVSAAIPLRELTQPFRGLSLVRRPGDTR